MKKGIILLSILVIVVAAGYALTRTERNNPTQPSSQSQGSIASQDGELLTVIAENLETPWALAFLPNGGILVTERPGRVQLVTADGESQSSPVATLEGVKEIGEGGLLGIAIHPEFATNNFVYLYYTYSSSGEDTLNRVVRMTFQNNKLENEEVIVDAIPGAANHDGGRIKFGPDNFLYIGTGDAQQPTQAQNRNSLAGKILRVTDEGKPAPGNPFNNAVYSYGHRNVQGLAWNSEGQFWSTEHGPSGLQSGRDELNLIEPGNNYGWPEIEGDETRSGMEMPKRHSGNTAWAPSGADFAGTSLFFSGLRGQTLYEAVISNGNVTELKEHFIKEFGRIREVVTGSDGMLYITTSNTDGRGDADDTDDKILKINPAKL